MNQWGPYEHQQRDLHGTGQYHQPAGPYQPTGGDYRVNPVNPFYQHQQYLLQERMHAKQLRRTFSPVGWTLVIYYLLMNVAVILVLVVDMVAKMLPMMLENPNYEPDIAVLTENAVNNAWGYILAVVIGLFVLLVWKGRYYWSDEIFAKGKPMEVGTFLGLLSLVLGVQLVASLLSTVLELILNQFGLSMMSILESASGQSGSLSMFIYASICAPITEEILFRGYVLRTLRPYGKKFAIFGSAVLFGLFHGNLIQTPYAFLVGLVLGYVAVEYNVIWAMVLHMVNNMVLADLLTRITSAISPELPDVVTGIVIIAFAIAAVVILIVKRRKIGWYLRRERMDRRCLKSFFGNAGVITMTVLMLFNLLMLITAI